MSSAISESRIAASSGGLPAMLRDNMACARSKVMFIANNRAIIVMICVLRI